IYPFVENNRKVFQCPDAYDLLAGSPTKGELFQTGYAMNAVSGGPAGMTLTAITNGNGTSQVFLVWDHGNIPACNASGRVPVPADAADVDRHYPPRHNRTFNVLYGDGHTASLTLSDWQLASFYAQ